MSRAHRLSSARDFRRVLATGRRARSEAVTCAAATSDRRGPARVGIRAPRAIGGSVVRNRANRRVRAAARAVPLRPGVDVVITARGPALTLEFQVLEASVRDALTRAGAA